MLTKRIQLGLIHTAVAITLVPFTSTLNRIMIHELGISATLVTMLIALPYLFGPVQVAIGGYADTHPIMGLRRTPYIFIGLLFCALGVFVAPRTAFTFQDNGVVGYVLAFLAFGAWGAGYNLAAVSYLSLASEIDEEGRSKTIATMFLIMIVGIIATAISIGRMVDPYTPEAMIRAFDIIGGVALVIGLIGLIGLEPRYDPATSKTRERHSWKEMTRAVLDNPQAKLFFWYLILMLAAILGQDVLLEPYGAAAFDLSPSETTRITSIWGTCMLITLLMSNPLQVRTSKKTVARIGAWIALAGFVVIAGSSLTGSSSVFYSGVVLLGLGTGFATVSNLSLMLDMTTAANVGLFIGAWGMANAFARLSGQLMSGVLRDLFDQVFALPTTSYMLVFLIEAGFLAASLIILRQIDVEGFQKQTGQSSLSEGAALMFEAGD